MRLAGSSPCQKWRPSPVEGYHSNAIGDRARAQVAGMANDWRSVNAKPTEKAGSNMTVPFSDDRSDQSEV